MVADSFVRIYGLMSSISEAESMSLCFTEVKSDTMTL